VTDNFLIGCLNLTDIPLTGAGHHQVTATVKIDANGITTLQAVDNTTGQVATKTFTANQGRLSPEEIERMLKAAEDFAEQDEASGEVVDARDALEGLAYDLRNQLEKDKQRLGGRLSEDMRGQLEDAVRDALEWLDENPSAAAEQYEERSKQLEELSLRIVSRPHHEDL
jgi:heat shock protein 5